MNIIIKKRKKEIPTRKDGLDQISRSRNKLSITRPLLRHKVMKRFRIRYWNQPVLSNYCKVSCSMEQRLAPNGVILLRLASIKLLAHRVGKMYR
jgi:hypothetical protein